MANIQWNVIAIHNEFALLLNVQPYGFAGIVIYIYVLNVVAMNLICLAIERTALWLCRHCYFDFVYR